MFFVRVHDVRAQQRLRRGRKVALQAFQTSREVRTDVIQENCFVVGAEAAKVTEEVFDPLVDVLDVILQVRLHHAANRTNLTAGREKILIFRKNLPLNVT